MVIIIPLTCVNISVWANGIHKNWIRIIIKKAFVIFVMFFVFLIFFNQNGSVITIKMKLGDISPPIDIIICEKKARRKIKYLLEKNVCFI